MTAATEWSSAARRSDGRRVGRNAVVGAAGVVSFPVELSSDWPRFQSATVAWLHRRYGHRLRAVVEHLDEQHPHLHFFVVPNPGESAATAHEGYAAQSAARFAPGNHVSIAFKKAMRSLQDDFHREVASQFGLKRVGPERRRLSRAAALDARSARDERAASQEQKQQLERREAEILTAEARLRDRMKELRMAQQHIRDLQQRLDARPEAAVVRELEELKAAIKLLETENANLGVALRLQREAEQRRAAGRASFPASNI